MSDQFASELFDIIIDQLLSGVRHDGKRISFRYTTDNDMVYSSAQMRKNFIEVVSEYKSQLRVDGDDYDLAISEVMSTIPILSTCIHGDDVDYFEKEIVAYVLKHQESM